MSWFGLGSVSLIWFGQVRHDLSDKRGHKGQETGVDDINSFSTEFNHMYLLHASLVT